ncbi:hypothetical protein ABW20_dc0101109 [Dactylellina cionopaga]|nr:hypothetical protein ABW20_dc0101109 [Dactylellina cionopaga]
MPNKYRDPYKEYTVAVIGPMEFEMSAFRYMLDRELPPLPTVQGDPNEYVLGELGGHKIVLACLPGRQGKATASFVATHLARTFLSIKWRFLIGTGGGVPSSRHDIRLGDVVVSMPYGQYGGIVEYDQGYDIDDDFDLRGFLYPPPTLARSAIGIMRSDHLVRDNRVNEFVSAMTQKEPSLSIYNRPPGQLDILYEADHLHITDEPTCWKCGEARIVNRPFRVFEGPKMHYGLIASGSRVMKSGSKRDKTAHDIPNILCFEMEAAGVATEYSWIVIRGISNYADSHKNDDWQHYAAAAAAASAKEILSYLDPENPSNEATPILAPSLQKPSDDEVGRLPWSDCRGSGVQHSNQEHLQLDGTYMFMNTSSETQNLPIDRMASGNDIAANSHEQTATLCLPHMENNISND